MPRSFGRTLRQISSHIHLANDSSSVDLLSGTWQSPFVLVEPVGLEPTSGFLPLIKSQVSAIQFEYDSKVGGSPGSRIPTERLRAAYAAVNTCDPLVDVVRVELTDWRL